MDPSEIARAGEEQCAYMGHVGGRPWFCVRRANHPGVHAAEPGPGETVTWPKEGDTGPMTGILGPYGLKPDTPWPTLDQEPWQPCADCNDPSFCEKSTMDLCP